LICVAVLNGNSASGVNGESSDEKINQKDSRIRIGSVPLLHVYRPPQPVEMKPP
jgi:hypothetical protein